jgi:hypothetical protein
MGKIIRARENMGFYLEMRRDLAYFEDPESLSPLSSRDTTETVTEWFLGIPASQMVRNL